MIPVRFKKIVLSPGINAGSMRCAAKGPHGESAAELSRETNRRQLNLSNVGVNCSTGHARQPIMPVMSESKSRPLKRRQFSLAWLLAMATVLPVIIAIYDALPANGVRSRDQGLEQCWRKGCC